MIVAATGHRPPKLGGYSQEVLKRATGVAQAWLETYNRPEKVIVGMAQGWDMAVALACSDLDIPFTAAIPFKGQEEKWPPDARFLYHRILHEADIVEIISPGGYAASKMHVRNRWMVDHADTILACWDGTDSGGTARCVEYAESKGKPIVNLWKAYNEST